MKARFKLAILFGVLVMAWIMLVDSERIDHSERLEFLEERVQTIYNMAVDNKNERIGQSYKTLTNLVKDYENGQEIISNYQTEQIEILRTQVNQLTRKVKW